ncbi:MAG: hypothetical protein A3G36_02525 [Omnitrophica bacterium RIFCSPLOWO2_12_FULL_45_13]|nr:MAG: hypothetical protein A3G36_02525 [Omnitrophica bacterium RIFCSPLOWO2_12_FULL_45_13]
MNKDGAFLRTIPFIAIILLLFTAVFLYIMKENERDKRVGLQRQVDELMMKEQAFEAKLKETEIANAQMAASIKFQEEKINMLAKSLEDEKEERGKNLAKIQGKEIETQNLKAKIEEVKAEKEGALKSLEKLNEEYLNMKFYMENLIKTKEELEKKAKDLAEREGVSLGTVVIKQPRS